jgi:uncharacterized repeat protein (TIGR02543 family)
MGTLGTAVVAGSALAGAVTPTTDIGCGPSNQASTTDISDLMTALSSSGTVDLTAGCTYALTTSNNNMDFSTSALPSITGTDTVNGGTGATITSSASNADIFEVATTGTLFANNLTISGAQNGAGVDDQGTATVDDSTVSDNTGTGLELNFADPSGMLTIEDSTVTGNSGSDGGAVGDEYQGTVDITGSTISDNTGSGAAAIDNDSDATNGTATMNITDSTISGNTGDDGGGIQNDGTLNVDNSTIADNDGTGISSGSGDATIDDSTISNNLSNNTQGPAEVDGFGSSPSTVTMAGDIVASPGGVPAGSTGQCQDSDIVDAGYNVDDDGSCGFSGTNDSESDSTTIDSFLGALADNGGPTETVAISGGTAHDANPAQGDIPSTFTAPGQSTAACSQADQRGTTRLTTCDMGAYALNTPITYAVTYADGTGTGTPPTDSTAYHYFDTATADSATGLTKPGFTFAGWNTAANGSGTTYQAGDTFQITGGVTLTAQWVGGPYTVTYSAGTGTGTPPTDSTEYTQGSAVTVAQPTGLSKAGATFTGWNTAADGSGQTYEPGETLFITANTVLTAQWAVNTGPTPPAPPAGSTGSNSASGNSSTGTVSASIGSETATGAGAGSITVATYGSNPSGATVTDGTGVFYDAAIGQGSTFSAVTITICNAGAGQSLQWFNGTVWAPFSDQSTAAGCLVATVTSTTSPTLADLTGTPIAVSTQAPPASKGYVLAASDGGVFALGTALYHGSMGGQHLNAPIVGEAATPSGNGYWLVAADGGVFSFGDAGFYGSMGSKHLNKPIVGMAVTPSGHGYWLVASDGGIFSFGDAGFFGSQGSTVLNKPVVGMATTASGKGYWLVASDGGIFSHGDAAFYGSQGSTPLNKPIVGMAATPSGNGYWLVASDGGVFSHGNAAFYGSQGSTVLNKPIVGMEATPSGNGYWLVAADGGIFTHGDAAYAGSLGSIVLDKPVVGITP